MSTSKSGKRVKQPARRYFRPAQDYDESRFLNKARENFYTKVIKHENLIESLFFDFPSLREVDIDLAPRFRELGFARFVSTPYNVYEELVKEFYSNFSHKVNEFGELEIESAVSGISLKFSETEMHQWFELHPTGYKVLGNFVYDSDDFDEHTQDPNMSGNKDRNKNYALTFLRERARGGQLEYNAYGLEFRMIHSALTRGITPKVHTQVLLRGMDQEMLYHFLRGNEVNLCHVVLYYMVSKFDLLSKDDYSSADRERHAGLPFGSILTHIFERHGVDFIDQPFVKIHKN